MSDRLERIERDMGALQRQIYRGQASGQYYSAAPVDGSAALADQSRLDQIQEQQRQITGSVEELQNSVTRLRSQLDRLSGDIDQRLSALEGGRPGGSGDSSASSAQPSNLSAPSSDGPRSPTASLNRNAVANSPRTLGPPTPLSPGLSSGGTLSNSPSTAGGADAGSSLPSGSAQEQYNHAFGLLRQSQYAEAEQALRTFVRRNPNDPLAANAQYWIGESFFNRGDYSSAAQAFAEAYQRYPNGSKAPDVLLGLGMSLSRMGQKSDACRTLTRLDREYQTAPGSIRERARSERQKLACA